MFFFNFQILNANSRLRILRSKIGKNHHFERKVQSLGISLGNINHILLTTIMFHEVYSFDKLNKITHFCIIITIIHTGFWV